MRDLVVDPRVSLLNLLDLLGSVVLADVEAVADVVGRLALLDLVRHLSTTSRPVTSSVPVRESGLTVSTLLLRASARPSQRCYRSALSGYRGASLIRRRPSPKDHHRDLHKGLLYGGKGAQKKRPTPRVITGP